MPTSSSSSRAAVREAAIVVAVSNEKDWPLDVPGVSVVRATDYLTRPEWSGARRVHVFNLCRSYRYQSTGYYVSLLATARRHVPLPSLPTILEMRSRSRVRTVDDELDDLVQASLSRVRSQEYTLSVYFGRNLAKRYDKLSLRLFNEFPAPLLRAHFVQEDGRWRLASVGPIAARRVPESHLPFVLKAARQHFERPRLSRRRKQPVARLAILHDPEEAMPPSDAGFYKRFTRAAEQIGISVDLIRREDYSRVAEFDALFIRETTYVNNHTFRFARRAQAEGLVVIDDPESILRCTNKVYQAEAFTQHKIPIPRTVVGTRSSVDAIADQVGLPCVLKVPDSAFSQGVVLCKSREELAERAEVILRNSDLFVAQEFLPSEFDWRIGVLDGRPLYACRYHMAAGHWQIIQRTAPGRFKYGRGEAVPLGEVPPFVVRTAVRASRVVGEGLYGIDLKQVGRRCVVIEVNDNPNLESGVEDQILGASLYERLAGYFLDRLQAQRNR